jgi:hypothetical protein
VGGLGSGRSGGSRFLAAEQCYGLDLAALNRAGFLEPLAKVSGPWRWNTNTDPETTAAVSVALDLRQLDSPTFTITYAAGEEPSSISGALLTTCPGYGGVRYWFECPRCGRRRRVLYAYPSLSRKRFACRRCHGLRYYSHRESREDRCLRRARKSWRRARSTNGTEPWEKPRWMRWTTFSRLVLAGRSAQEEGDIIMLGKLGAGLARIMRSPRAARRKKS